jgi:hypothetical protein
VTAKPDTYVFFLFVDPDAPLTTVDKINFGILITILYASFVVSVVLTSVYNS